MNIMIAGAGTVGYSLAQTLSFRHDVIVIDKDIKKLHKLDESTDVMIIRSDVEDPKTYQALDKERIDLFIAVTDSDEANLLATLIAEDVVSIDRKIIRLKNDAFLKSHVLQKLSIDHAVFPDITTANKVKELLRFPRANNVKKFHQTKLKLVSIHVDWEEEKQYHVADFCDERAYVAGIERNKDFFIPQSDEVLKQGDLVYFFGQAEHIEMISEKLDETMPSVIKRVVIFGADTLAQKIAKTLVDKKLEIKMIAEETALCKQTSELLGGKVTVINASHEDRHIFEEEGLGSADIVIAAEQSDEKNIIKCIEAKEYGVQKVVAINNDQNYYDLMHKLGVVVVRGSKAGAHYAILETIASSSIVTQRLFCGGRGILFMRKIYADSDLIGQTLKPLLLEDVTILLVREEKIYPFSETMLLAHGDIVVVFGNIEQQEKIQQWIYAH